MPPSPEALRAPKIRIAAALIASSALSLSMSQGNAGSEEGSGNYPESPVTTVVNARAYGNLIVRDCVLPNYFSGNDCSEDAFSLPSLAASVAPERTYTAIKPTDISISSSLPTERPEAKPPGRSLNRKAVIVVSPKPTYIFKPKPIAAAKPALPPKVVPGLHTKVIRIPNWSQLAQCESTSNPKINTGNGFFGAYQFDQQTWESVGGLEDAPRADLATLAQQTNRAQILFNRRGPQPWPDCTKKTNWERIVKTIVVKKAA